MDVPPTGTITFLFTDIEGSTRLWEEYPTAMREALRRHDDLLRHTIEAHQGHVFKTVGDAFHAAFAEPRAALEAAVAAQQALAGQDWEEIEALRVRMALHTGVAEVRQGDYFGLTLSQLARLLSAGHGGQILVSPVTAELIQDSLPEDVGLRDLGPHRLRDLARPVQVFQVQHPSLRQDSPPLRALNAFPHNLPVQLTSFIGRERELQEIRKLLKGTHLLTLTGSGGCGKTRLALQVAAELLDEYPHGVYLAELAALSDPALVPREVARALQLEEESDRSVADTLVVHLRPQHLLLVLDNCEHLLEDCAYLVGRLLTTCPDLRILATSREALRVMGETVWKVPSLSTPALGGSESASDVVACESVQLFIERTAAVNPRFRLTDRDAPWVAQICRRLDGIPQAIELAAARMNVLSARQIAQRLDDRFQLLRSGPRTSVPRHQTLRAAIDWSHNLLPPDERALLRRLAVFAGGWTLEAVEDVCAGDGIEAGQVLDLLCLLVDKSLVMADENEEGAVRYRLLETVREYALEQLREAEEEEALRRRHLAFFLRLAEQAETELQGPDQSSWTHALATEHDNLRAALRWSLAGEAACEGGLSLAGSLWYFWYQCAYASEGRHWLEIALRHCPNAPAGLQALAWSGMGNLAQLQGDMEAARHAHEEGLRLRRSIGDERGTAGSLMNLGILINRQGDHDRARTCLEESLETYRRLGDRHLMAIALSNMAGIAIEQGDIKSAAPLLEESLSIMRELEDKGGIARVTHNIGDVARQRGDIARAGRLYRESLRISRDLGDLSDIDLSFQCLAWAATRQQDLSRAARLLGAARSARETLGKPEILDQEEQELLVALRRELGEEKLEEQYEDGRVMSLEEVIAFALQEEEG